MPGTTEQKMGHIKGHPMGNLRIGRDRAAGAIRRSGSTMETQHTRHISQLNQPWDTNDV